MSKLGIKRSTSTGRLCTDLDLAGEHETLTAALEAERESGCSSTVDGFTVGLSSGTSGSRALFAMSPEEQARWAGRVPGRLPPDWWRPHRIALFLRTAPALFAKSHTVKMPAACAAAVSALMSCMAPVR